MTFCATIYSLMLWMCVSNDGLSRLRHSMPSSASSSSSLPLTHTHSHFILKGMTKILLFYFALSMSLCVCVCVYVFFCLEKAVLRNQQKRMLKSGNKANKRKWTVERELNVTHTLTRTDRENEMYEDMALAMAQTRRRREGKWDWGT